MNAMALAGGNCSEISATAAVLADCIICAADRLLCHYNPAGADGGLAVGVCSVRRSAVCNAAGKIASEDDEKKRDQRTSPSSTAAGRASRGQVARQATILHNSGMAFRFRRSLRLASGIRINLSETGASLSLGRRGATLNFNRRGTKATVGLPGTGLSYSTMLKSGAPTALPPDEGPGGDGTIIVAVVAFVTLLALLIAL
jgi:hypothetical protein